MSTLPRKTQLALLTDLKVRWQLKRYAKERSWGILAQQLGCATVTVVEVAKRGTSVRLTPDQVTWLLKMRKEYDEAIALLRGRYSFRGIAKHNGVGLITAERYHERCLLDGDDLPICTEEFRKAA